MQKKPQTIAKKNTYIHIYKTLARELQTEGTEEYLCDAVISRTTVRAIRTEMTKSNPGGSVLRLMANCMCRLLHCKSVVKVVHPNSKYQNIWQ